MPRPRDRQSASGLLSDAVAALALAGVTRRHATGQIVKRPGFPAPCINASQRLRAWPTAKVLAYFRGIGNAIGSETERSGAA
jgi:hypothetical protein